MQSVSCLNPSLLAGVALCALCLTSSCGRTSANMTPPSDVPQTNADRQRIGIRQIKPTWVLDRREFNAEDWKPNASPGPACKRVQRAKDSNRILWEEDYYYSGGTYTDADGTGWEHVAIHYDYPSGEFQLHYLGTNAALHALAEPFRTGTTNSAAVTKAADAVLKSIGLPRL